MGLSELWKDVESVANGELGGKGWRRCTAPESHPESVQAGQHRCIFLSFSAGWVSFWREISIISCTAEVEAELSFLEQEILEKFRNQASVGIGRHQLSWSEKTSGGTAPVVEQQIHALMVISWFEIVHDCALLSLQDDILPSGPVAILVQLMPPGQVDWESLAQLGRKEALSRGELNDWCDFQSPNLLIHFFDGHILIS